MIQLILATLLVCGGSDSYDLSAEPCGAGMTPEIELCECGEVLMWEGEYPMGDPDYWIIERCELSKGGVCLEVGQATVSHWYFEDDRPIGRTPRLYAYAVIPVTTFDGATMRLEKSNPVYHRAIPYTCVEEGSEVRCYPGDKVINR